MNMQEAVRSAFGKYVTFSGRARRAEYWWFALFCVIVALVVGVVDYMIFGGTVTQIEGGYSYASNGPLAAIWSLVILLPAISVLVRRLHDTGRSGWWYWILLVPLVGVLLLLWWLTRPGDQGPNAYGPDPITG